MNLNSVSRIAEHILNIYDDVPQAIVDEAIDIVESNKVSIENYTMDSIDSYNIPDKYVPAILAFSKADILGLINAQSSSGVKLRLADLSVDETGKDMSPEFWTKLGEIKLKSLGRGTYHKRSLS